MKTKGQLTFAFILIGFGALLLVGNIFGVDFGEPTVPKRKEIDDIITPLLINNVKIQKYCQIVSRLGNLYECL